MCYTNFLYHYMQHKYGISACIKLNPKAHSYHKKHIDFKDFSNVWKTLGKRNIRDISVEKSKIIYWVSFNFSINITRWKEKILYYSKQCNKL